MGYPMLRAQPHRRIAGWLGVAALTVLLVGCTGTTAGQGLYLGAGPATPPTSASTSAPTTTSAPSTTTESTSTEPTSSSPPPTTTSAPPPTTSGSAPPPSGEPLAADGWTVESFTYGAGAVELFDGDARITNTADVARSALYTFTLFDGETIVATFVGASSAVPPGATIDVPLISGDTFVAGEFSVDFEAVSF